MRYLNSKLPCVMNYGKFVNINLLIYFLHRDEDIDATVLQTVQKASDVTSIKGVGKYVYPSWQVCVPRFWDGDGIKDIDVTVLLRLYRKCPL